VKRTLCILGLLAGFGCVKTNAEHHLFAAQRAAGFQLATLSGQIRSQLGQTGFVAALSGFRALMADLLWIRAGSAFDRTEWPRMQMLLHAATQLQPRAVVFWEMAHFHMAYDASHSMRLNVRQQPVAALRRIAELEYVRIGEDFLKAGLVFNPDSATLWQRLGELYSRRRNDPARAAEAYAEAARKPGALKFLRRMAAYELAKVPGSEKEAYAQLRSLYLEGEQERLPNLVRLLQQLEEKLAVPEASRVYIPSSVPSPSGTRVPR
jgi:hypothetical protein